MKTKKFTVSAAEVAGLKNRNDAEMLLIKPKKSHDVLCFDYEVIPFASRAALEAFNKKAGLAAVVPKQVPLGCAIYAHESDSDARAAMTSVRPLVASLP